MNTSGSQKNPTWWSAGIALKVLQSIEVSCGDQHSMTSQSLKRGNLPPLSLSFSVLNRTTSKGLGEVLGKYSPRGDNNGGTLDNQTKSRSSPKSEIATRGRLNESKSVRCQVDDFEK